MILYVFAKQIFIILLIFIFKIGINANINKPLSIEILEEMNIGQLQVLVNDLYCQIEGR
jgi:hypothetical protein